MAYSAADGHRIEERGNLVVHIRLGYSGNKPRHWQAAMDPVIITLQWPTDAAAMTITRLAGFSFTRTVEDYKLKALRCGNHNAHWAKSIFDALSRLQAEGLASGQREQGHDRTFTGYSGGMTLSFPLLSVTSSPTKNRLTILYPATVIISSITS